jgi:uncharacterized protein (DUF3084 family)
MGSCHCNTDQDEKIEKEKYFNKRERELFRKENELCEKEIEIFEKEKKIINKEKELINKENLIKKEENILLQRKTLFNNISNNDISNNKITFKIEESMLKTISYSKQILKKSKLAKRRNIKYKN